MIFSSFRFQKSTAQREGFSPKFYHFFVSQIEHLLQLRVNMIRMIQLCLKQPSVHLGNTYLVGQDTSDPGVAVFRQHRNAGIQSIHGPL